jgi:hypothetical protein
MLYSLDKLKTIAECDAILAAVQLELKEFQTDLANIDLRQGKADSTEQKRAVSLALNRAEVVGLEAALPTLTDPDAIASLTGRLTKVRNRVENLEVDTAGKGVFALLKMELDINQLEESIKVNQDLINQVTVKKGTL